ncbi:MAG: choice-of-anchor Q domain-containing protein, partial [Planctomycetota bacterium]
MQGRWRGEGNIDWDPCFVRSGWDANGTPDYLWDDFWVGGDYHLRADSPCINAGDPCYVVGPNETDIEGRPRVICGLIDMGAYEHQGECPLRVHNTTQDTYHSKIQEAIDDADDGDEIIVSPGTYCENI